MPALWIALVIRLGWGKSYDFKSLQVSQQMSSLDRNDIQQDQALQVWMLGDTCQGVQQEVQLIPCAWVNLGLVKDVLRKKKWSVVDLSMMHPNVWAGDKEHTWRYRQVTIGVSLSRQHAGRRRDMSIWTGERALCLVYRFGTSMWSGTNLYVQFLPIALKYFCWLRFSTGRWLSTFFVQVGHLPWSNLFTEINSFPQWLWVRPLGPHKWTHQIISLMVSLTPLQHPLRKMCKRCARKGEQT